MLKKFNVLTKICLELELMDEYNNLNIQDMKIEYNYNMKEGKIDKLTNYPTNYPIEIEYTMNIKKFKLPRCFRICFTNSHNSCKEEKLKIFQKNKKEEKNIEIPLKEQEYGTLDPMIRHCSYILNDSRNFIQKLKRDFQMFFSINYHEEEILKHDRIIVYPKQFSRRMKNLEVIITFSGKKVKISNNTIGRIIYNDKNKDEFTEETIRGIRKSNQEIMFNIDNIENTDNKVIYIDIYWEPIEDIA